jgi:hypothetical protein
LSLSWLTTRSGSSILAMLHCQLLVMRLQHRVHKSTCMHAHACMHAADAHAPCPPCMTVRKRSCAWSLGRGGAGPAICPRLAGALRLGLGQRLERRISQQLARAPRRPFGGRIRSCFCLCGLPLLRRGSVGLHPLRCLLRGLLRRGPFEKARDGRRAPGRRRGAWAAGGRGGAGAWPGCHFMSAPRSAQDFCVNRHGFC